MALQNVWWELRSPFKLPLLSQLAVIFWRKPMEALMEFLSANGSPMEDCAPAALEEPQIPCRHQPMRP
jgi:hypothetical protein